MVYYYYMPKNGKFIVLEVDDDGDMRLLLRTKLEVAGFAVEEAENGQVAFEKAKAIKPDMILLDVQMPVMNGIETLSKIKSDPETAGLKVLFLTNYGEANTADQPLDEKFAKDIGALGHLRKTEDLDKVIERVKKELQPVSN